MRLSDLLKTQQNRQAAADAAKPPAPEPPPADPPVEAEIAPSPLSLADAFGAKRAAPARQPQAWRPSPPAAPPQNAAAAEPVVTPPNAVSSPVELDARQLVEPAPADSATPPAVPVAVSELALPDVLPTYDLAATLHSAKADDDTSIYDDTPKGIYEAARKLNIAIPRSSDEIIQTAVASLDSIYAKLGDSTVPANELAQQVRDIGSELETMVSLKPNFVRKLTRQYPAECTLLWHSINTALIAMDMARRAPRGDASVLDIGIAALLHDTGLLSEKHVAKMDQQSNKYQDHVRLGVANARHLDLPELIVTIIAQHHERIDGSGFPEALRANEVLPASQILGLADLLEHLISGRANYKVPDDQSYIQVTLQRNRNKFSSQLLKTLIALRGFYPAGSMVELNNRTVAIVLKQNEGQPLRPVVQILVDSAGNHPDQPKIFDLCNNSALSIIRAVGNINDASH